MNIPRPMKAHDKCFRLSVIAAVAGLAFVCWAGIARSSLDAAFLDAVVANRTHEAVAMLERGADPNARANCPTCGTEPLRGTWTYYREWVLRGFGQRRQEDEKPALVLAAERGDITLVETLLRKGAEINGQDGNRRTALMWAARSRHTKLVRLLLERGADVHGKDRHGMTALLWADANSDDEAVAMLEQADARGHTP